LVDAFGISARERRDACGPDVPCELLGLPFMSAMTGAKQVMIGQDMAAKRLVDIGTN